MKSNKRWSELIYIDCSIQKKKVGMHAKFCHHIHSPIAFFILLFVFVESSNHCTSQSFVESTFFSGDFYEWYECLNGKSKTFLFQKVLEEIFWNYNSLKKWSVDDSTKIRWLQIPSTSIFTKIFCCHTKYGISN